MSEILQQLLGYFEQIAADKDFECNEMSQLMQFQLHKSQISSQRLAGYLFGVIPHQVVQLRDQSILDYHARIWLKWYLPEQDIPHGLVRMENYPAFYPRFRAIPSAILIEGYIQRLLRQEKDRHYEQRYQLLSRAYQERIERAKNRLPEYKA